MSTGLKDFLRQQAEKYQAEVLAGKADVEDWRAAVERLFTQIRAWLKDSDPQGFIEIKESSQNIIEPGLGRYQVPRLDLYTIRQWIGIIPKARRTVATATPPRKSVPERAAGRVDITDEVRRFVLYRFRQDSQDVWMIDDLASDPKPFNREAFEKALMSYLQ